MEKFKFTVRFTNGADYRSVVTEQPDAIFAAMFGQRNASEVFGHPWNQVPDQRKWKIIVFSENGEKLHEEPVVIFVALPSALQ